MGLERGANVGCLREGGRLMVLAWEFMRKAWVIEWLGRRLLPDSFLAADSSYQVGRSSP